MNPNDIASSIHSNIAQAQKMLETQDWIVTGGFAPLNGQPTYSYSLGLSSKFWHPEILIVGFEFEMCRQIINAAGNLIKERGADFSQPILSARVVPDATVAFRPLAASATKDGFQYGKRILDVAQFRLVQLFLPDENGYFPWNRKVERRMGKAQMAMFKHEGALPMQHAPEN
jgi:hypothetical protein